jgi:hypothetical protein
MGAILRTRVLFVAGLAATFCTESAWADATTPAGTELTALAAQASSAQSAGRLDEAAELLARARRMSPTDLGLLRSSCEVALAREQLTGKKVSNAVSSRAFCHSAYLRGGSPQDMRNEVASLLSPAEHPSLDDLVIAALNADAAVHSAPDQPWGYAARCDIARRLGSADVMETCLADLERQAPNQAVTKDALSLGRESTSLVAWFVRALLLLTFAGTLAYARLAGRRARRREATVPGKVAAAMFVIVCVFSGAMAGTARAAMALADGKGTAAPLDRRAPQIKRESLSRFKIDDADPEGSLPDAKKLADGPLQYGYLIQDLAAKAQQADKRGDRAAAIRYYRALSKITPKSPFAPRMLCNDLEATGDLATAVMACRTVLTLEGVTAQDYVHFVHLQLTKSGQVDPAERKEIESVMAHLAAQPNLGIAPVALRCDVALKFEEVRALESCTQELARLAPTDPRTVSFQWALAIQKKQRSVALQLIDKARAAGVSTSGVTMMESETHRMVMRQTGRFALIGICAVAFGILLTVGFRHLKRRRLPA